MPDQTTAKTLSGQCLCGAVRFELLPPQRGVIVCHCRQCARWSGHAVAATAVTPHHLRLLTGQEFVKWYASSEHAARGFCVTCGSSLFWRPNDGTRISVLAGSLDPPTGLGVVAHIFVADMSDYYEITDDAKQCEAGADMLALPHGLES